ncbi:MAG UNVERIFIED_CONTAM: hypothetical protein LVR29_16010 [Microcystis novacekii LVE1205-3]
MPGIRHPKSLDPVGLIVPRSKGEALGIGVMQMDWLLHHLANAHGTKGKLVLERVDEIASSSSPTGVCNS